MLDVQWTTTRDDGETTVALSGELDVAGCAAVAEELERAESEAPARLVLDLRRLGFIDSSGLRVLMGAHGRAQAAERELRVLVAAGTVARAIELTKLDEVLPIVTDAPAGDPV